MIESALERLIEVVAHPQNIEQYLNDFDAPDMFIAKHELLYASRYPLDDIEITWNAQDNSYLINVVNQKGQVKGIVIDKVKYFQQYTDTQVSFFTKRIRKYLLTIPDIQRKTIIHNLIRELTIQLDKVKKGDYTNRGIIIEALNACMDFCNQYVLNKYVVGEQKVAIKLKWLGQTNVLTTLFYDLLIGTKSNVKMIDADKTTLANFIVNNFLAEDGQQLSYNTIYSNLTKDGKLAKNPIEIIYHGKM